MSKQCLLKDEITDNFSDQESKVIIPKEEPKIEEFESKFLVKNEWVENTMCGKTIILPSKDEPVNAIGFPKIKVENQENIEQTYPTSFDIKSEPFEIISDNYCLISSIKKETTDIEIEAGFAQEKVIQSISHEVLETDPLDIKPKIEPIEGFGTELFQYQGKFYEETKNTQINASPDEQLDLLCATDNMDDNINARASKGRKRKCTTKELTNYVEKGEDEDNLGAKLPASKRLKKLPKKKDSENEKLRPFKCADCDSYFRQKKVLKNHMKRVHLKINFKKIPCTICEAWFEMKTQLQEHINAIHLKVKPYKCDSCDSSFAYKRALTGHIRIVHHKIKPFKCSNCSASFPQDKDLKQHVLAVHEKLKPFKCTTCDHSFSQKVHLKFHVDKVHLKLETLKKNKCSKCEACFEKKQLLDRHMNLSHLKVKPFKCEACDSSFSRKDQLKFHFDSVHLGVKNHTCSECDKAFALKFDLKKHIDRIHLNVKPMKKCDSCDSIFHTNYALKRHIDGIHLKIKNHKCANCNKAFSSKYNLNMHIKTKH